MKEGRPRQKSGVNLLVRSLKRRLTSKDRQYTSISQCLHHAPVSETILIEVGKEESYFYGTKRKTSFYILSTLRDSIQTRDSLIRTFLSDPESPMSDENSGPIHRPHDRRRLSGETTIDNRKSVFSTGNGSHLKDRYKSNRIPYGVPNASLRTYT